MKNFVLLQDKVNSTQQESQRKNIMHLHYSILTQPPYSLELTPNDFYLLCSQLHPLNDKNIFEEGQVKIFAENLLSSKQAEFS